MTVSKTSSGRWRARVKSGRAVVASRTFDRKGDAQTWHDAQRRALDLGDFVDPRAGRESVGSMLERWMKSRAHTVAGKTLKEEGYSLKRVPPSLRNRPVGAVTVADLERWYGDLLRTLARPTVVRQRNTMSSAFGWAVREGLVARNVVLDSVVPRGRGDAPKREPWPFNAEELRAVHADVRAMVADKGAADLILVLGFTGIRWGELAALRVRDVALVPRPSFYVSRSRPDGQTVRVTKSGKPRTVPLADEVVAIVAPLLVGRRPDDPLFPTTVGSMRLLSNWKRATDWKRHGRGRTVKDLRHSAATLWLSNGLDLKTVQTWLGHSTARLTTDTYAHWMGSDSDAAALAKLNTALRGDARGTRVRNLRAEK